MQITTQRHAGWVLTAFLAIASLGLAACGSTATLPAAGSSTGTSITTQQSTTGCPSANSTALRPPASIVVHSTGELQQVNAKVGDIIEVQLPFGHRYALFPLSGAILSVQNPSGFGDASAQSCIWRFKAAQAGSTSISFVASAICKPGVECPQYEVHLAIAIHVQG